MSLQYRMHCYGRHNTMTALHPDTHKSLVSKTAQIWGVQVWTILDPVTGSCLRLFSHCSAILWFYGSLLAPINRWSRSWGSTQREDLLEFKGLDEERNRSCGCWYMEVSWGFWKWRYPRIFGFQKNGFFWMIWGSPVLWHPTCWLMVVLQESPDYRLSKKQTSADSLLFEQAQLVNSPPIWVLQRASKWFVDIRWYKCIISAQSSTEVHFQSRQLPDVFVWLDQARFSHLSGSLQSKNKVKKKPPLGGRWVILSNFTLCFCSDFLWKIAQLKVIDDLWRWFTYSRLTIFQCAKHESLPKGTPTAPERGRWTWRWLEPEDEGPIWGAKSGA